MKRYAYKLMATIAVIAAFVMLINSNINIDLEKGVRTLANSQKLASTCTPGTPTTYYVTTDSTSIRSSAEETSNNTIATVNKCTVVTVYCTTGTWARVSNSSSKYISISLINTTKPSGCSSTSTTTTNPVTFTLGTPTLTPSEIYIDRAGTVKIPVNSVTNLAAGEEYRFNVKITNPGGVDVTSKFNIQKGTLNGSSLDISIIKKTGETFTYGTYTVTISAEKASNAKTVTFTMVNKYYDFVLDMVETTDYKNTPTNKTNQWKIDIKDIIPTTANRNKFSIKIIKKDTQVDCTSKFNINFNSTSDYYTVSNIAETGDNRWSGNYAQEGTYEIQVSFYDPTYSTSRGTVTKTETITLGRADPSYKENTENRLSYRYTPVYSQHDYTIEIMSKSTVNGINYYTFLEDGKEVTLTEKTLEETYGSLDLDNVQFENGPVVIKYGTQVMITNYKQDSAGTYQVTFKAASTNLETLSATEFQQLYPTAYDLLVSGIYSFGSDGSLRYKNTGVGTKNLITYSIMSDKIRIPLSTTGGEYTFEINYTELEAYDFQNATLSLVGPNNKNIIVNNQVYDENFELSWDYTTYLASKKLLIYLKYRGTNPEYYNGSYTVKADFGKYGVHNIKFDLNDGNTDYYLYSEYDSHITSDDPMDGNINPQSNKKYEYYIGFYMMKGGQLLPEIDKSSINYRIYNRRADYDNNGNMYFFDQVDYDVKIKKVLNNTITFDESLDYGATFTENLQLSLTEFRNKYGDATADLISKYTYDANGNISGDNYPLEIKRFYTVEGETDMTVVYVEPNSTTEKSLKLAEFKLKYPEMYGYLVTKFVFDTSGNIILGELMGNYRVTTDKNGNPLQGREVSDQFNVKINTETTNPARTITILPKTEVEPGDYFIYVSYGAAYPGVGYVNNSPDDPAISKELFPEMWNQNTHMTSFSYSEPKYTITIKEPLLTNSGNTTEKNYSNIPGTVDFDISLNYIYDLEGVAYEIQYSSDGTNWVSANDHFTVTTDFKTGASKLVLSNVVGKVKKGQYKLLMSYTKDNYSSEVASRTFEISGNYYGLIIDKTQKIKFIHNNDDEAQKITAEGHFISNPDDIQISISRKIDDINYEDYIWDKANKRFVNEDGAVEFTYDIEIEDIGNSGINYILKLSNHAFVTPVGTYLLKYTYQEPDGELTSSEFTFIVDEDQYIFELSDEEIPVANSTEQYIKRDLKVHYFDYDYLDDIQYTIFYYHQGKYIDVSSENSEYRMFKIRYAWEERPDLGENEDQQTTYEGILYIDLIKEMVDRDGAFYIELRYGDMYDEFIISNLRELFSWNIENVSIYGTFTDEAGEVTDVDKFYNNIEDTTLDITLKTMHEESASYKITQECLNESEECIPNTVIDYNNRFDLITNENNHIVLRLKSDLDDNLKLEQGLYAILVYYANDDYRKYEFEVIGDYVGIELGKATIETKISTNKIVNDVLFRNKDSVITIPVKVRGVPYTNAQVSITDLTGTIDKSGYFSYDRTEFITNHNLVVTYSSTSEIPAGEYMIMVSYTNYNGEIVSDNIILLFNEIYFNYTVTNTIYDPIPAVPNAEGGGSVILAIETEDMISGSIIEQNEVKQMFIDNIIITDELGNDVTDKFEKSYTNQSSIFNFNVVLKYAENTLEPGSYTVNLSYTKSNYNISSPHSFEMGDYERRIDIESVEIISNTTDKKMHNNIGGIFKVNYSSNYLVYTSDLIVSVFDKNKNNVTSSFSIEKTNDYVQVIYDPTEPYITPGDYVINLLYTDPQTGTVDSNSTTVKIYGEYKAIEISEMTPSSTRIYADLDNQYYTFKLKTDTLSTEEVANIKARIYDEYGNIVYSNISSDNASNLFEVEKISDSEYKINILAFKARVANYYAVLCLPSDETTYYESNQLQFAVNSTYYDIKLKDTSSITPIESYDDENTIYDYIGANAIYQFTSNYDKGDAKYSIKIINKGIVIKEIKNLNIETASGYYQTEFEFDNIISGDIEVALCLNGLVYDYKEISVKEYIKVTNAIIVLDNKDVTDNITLNIGDIKEFEIAVEPENATNKNLLFTSSNINVATFDGNTIKVIGSGESTITLSNKEYSVDFKLSVADRITSNKYEIDYTNNTIYVSSMTSLSLTKETFVNNIIGLYNTYSILDSKGNDVTTTTKVVGTNYSIVNGTNTYKVILIGDLINCNGTIDLGDVSYLFQLYRGKVNTSDANILKAAHIRRGDNINLGDVAKLFQFYRGKINEI